MQNSSPECGCEGGVSPELLVANTVIEISLPLDEHGRDISPNVWQHRPLKHEEAGIVAEPQILPEEASCRVCDGVGYYGRCLYVFKYSYILIIMISRCIDLSLLHVFPRPPLK